MRTLLLSLIILTLYSTPASANLDKQFKDWSVFTIDQDGKKVCYITSLPKNEKGNYKRRGEPYLLVTYRDKDIAEVSVSSGYPYKLKSNVEIKMDNKATFELFTTDETPKIAWARDANADRKIIAAMVKGVNLKAKGYSRLGTWSEDTYSLLGFTAAKSRMQELCK